MLHRVSTNRISTNWVSVHNPECAAEKQMPATKQLARLALLLCTLGNLMMMLMKLG
jgi:hypothetical protein